MSKCLCKECISEQVCDTCLNSFTLGTMIAYPVYRDARTVVRRRYYCTDNCATLGEIPIEQQKKHIGIDIPWIQKQWMRPRLLRPK